MTRLDSTTRDLSFEGTSNRRAILLSSEFHCMEKYGLKMKNRDDWVEEGRKERLMGRVTMRF